MLLALAVRMPAWYFENLKGEETGDGRHHFGR